MGRVGPFFWLETEHAIHVCTRRTEGIASHPAPADQASLGNRSGCMGANKSLGRCAARQHAPGPTHARPRCLRNPSGSFTRLAKRVRGSCVPCPGLRQKVQKEHLSAFCARFWKGLTGGIRRLLMCVAFAKDYCMIWQRGMHYPGDNASCVSCAG